MKLYQTIDGTMIGFYRERGGEIQASMYRDVYEMRQVTKTREVQIWVESTYVAKHAYIPGFYDTRTLEIPGRFERRAVLIPARDVRRLVQVPGYYERRYVQEPGKYEIQSVWTPEYYVTRYYWRDAYPARGLVAAWIPYQYLVPAGYKDQRVWVEGAWRAHIFWVDATWAYKTVTIPEHWGSQTIWIEPVSTTEQVWIPARYIDTSTGVRGHWTTGTVEYLGTELVWTGYEPVYSFVDQTQVRLFEVLDLIKAPVGVAGAEDHIVIRNMLTGEELTTSARYIGYGTKIADNEYVVP